MKWHGSSDSFGLPPERAASYPPAGSEDQSRTRWIFSIPIPFVVVFAAQRT